jgi:hypothetical protein
MKSNEKHAICSPRFETSRGVPRYWKCRKDSLVTTLNDKGWRAAQWEESVGEECSSESELEAFAYSGARDYPPFLL